MLLRAEGRDVAGGGELGASSLMLAEGLQAPQPASARVAAR